MTIDDILSRFERVKPAGPFAWMARCSAHQDTDNSLSLKAVDDKMLVNCFAGCETERVVGAAGLTMTDLFFAPPTPSGRREVCAYDYHDETGTLLYQVVRYAAPKDFRMRRPASAGWTWNVKGVRRVVYRLHELTDQARVILCEGEKDADRLVTRGLAATTIPGGSSAWKARYGYAEQLQKAGATEVIIPPDNDDGGRTLVGDAAPDLARVGIAVRVLALPGLGPKDDVSDWFDAGHDVDEFLALAASALPFVPADRAAPATEAETEPGPKVLMGGAIGTTVVTEPAWLVEGLFSEPDQHLIVGSSSGAKTWMLFDLCLAVSHPRISTYLGQPVRRHGRVCLESWEQGQTEDLRRLHKLARGHALPIATSFDALILLSETPGTLNDESYFTKRLRELIEWGVILYGVDSLSQAAGIELNDNTAYGDWWRARMLPILDAGITIALTHLTGHVKPGVGRTREAVVRNATQIRALSSNIIEGRQLGETTFKLHHNKHRNNTGVTFGGLELAGTMADPFVTLRLTAAPAAVPPATKEALARRLLLALGAKHPDAWLTRKAIEAALNAPDATKRIDPKERVSKRAWEPALDALVAEGGFELGKLRQADAWRLKTAEPVFEQCSSSFEPDSDEDEDEP